MIGLVSWRRHQDSTFTLDQNVLFCRNFWLRISSSWCSLCSFCNSKTLLRKLVKLWVIVNSVSFTLLLLALNALVAKLLHGFFTSLCHACICKLSSIFRYSIYALSFLLICFLCAAWLRVFTRFSFEYFFSVGNTLTNRWLALRWCYWLVTFHTLFSLVLRCLPSLLWISCSWLPPDSLRLRRPCSHHSLSI